MPAWQRINLANILQEKEPHKTQAKTQQWIMCWELSLFKQVAVTGTAHICPVWAGRGNRSLRKGLWMLILHRLLCLPSVVKQVRKKLVFPALSNLWAGLSSHFLPSPYPTGTHIMAALTSDWLIFSVPAPVQGTRTQGSVKTPVASPCDLGQSVYCTDICLSLYVLPEHKGTSFVPWEPPPHIPGCTSPCAAPTPTAWHSQERQPKIWVIHSRLYPCCAVGLEQWGDCPPAEQAEWTETSCIFWALCVCDLPEGSCTCLGALKEGMPTSHSPVPSTHLQSFSAELRTSACHTGFRICIWTLKNCYRAQEILMNVWKILCILHYSNKELCTHRIGKNV